MDEYYCLSFAVVMKVNFGRGKCFIVGFGCMDDVDDWGIVRGNGGGRVWCKRSGGQG